MAGRDARGRFTITDRLQAAARRKVEFAAKALALQINRELRRPPPLGTPVQDGNARANWIPSVGSPSSYEGEGTAGGNAAAAQGQAAVAAWNLGDGDLFIVNRTPYIRRLNNGWSKQSAALFVEAAIERAKSVIKAKLGVDFGGLGVDPDASAQDISGGGAANLASAYSPFGGDE